MLKKTKLSVIGVFVFIGIVGGVVGATIPVSRASAACNDFLTFPQWYKGITVDDCRIASVDEFANKRGIDMSSQAGQERALNLYIWSIALNIVEIAIQVIAYIAFFFVLYGGFIYLTSNGSQERAVAGRKTILNAAVGIVLAMSAIALKNFLWTVVIGGRSNEYGIYDGKPEDILIAGLGATYFIAGAVAVIVIIVSGLTYITATADPGRITAAKNRLLYAVIGLIIVIAAASITRFVAGAF